MTDFDAPQNKEPIAAAAADSAAELPPEALRDQDLDETNVMDALNARGGVTVSMLASMASLDVVIPGGGALQGIFDTLFRSKEMNDDFSISNLGGSLETYFKYLGGEVDQNGQKIEGKDDDGWDEYMDAAQERREREERMREEWAETRSSFAGVEMTGEEWGQLAEDIAPNGKLHDKLIDWYMKKGKTKAQAEKKAADDEELYRIQSTPPALRTPEEQKKLDQANSDPEFREATNMLNEQRSTQANALEQKSQTSGQNVSVSSGADVFESDTYGEVSPSRLSSSLQPNGKDFPTAPDLTAHHQAAMIATEPLDTAKPAPQIAAAAPSPPGGGFDV